MENRRSFLKKGALAAAAAPLLAAGCKPSGQDKYGIDLDTSLESTLIVPKKNALPITGTFLDEISHDIPHQNWGEAEWDQAGHLYDRYREYFGL